MKTKKLNLTLNLFAGAALAFVGLAMEASSSHAQDGATLSAVKSKGFVQCGVSQGLPGFSNADDAGNWTGIDVDVCRGIAAAVFDDADAVKYTPLSAKERFTALQSGEIDVLSRNTTWTLQRDTGLGIVFTGVNYYDGQGFMVRKSLGVSSALELAGASVCTNTGTTTELNAADYFRANNMDYELVPFEKTDEAVVAYDNGRCDVYTTDQSGLYANRLKMTDPSEQVVLPEVISKEPLGPAVRVGDAQWANIVKWTLFAMLNAEELGITQGNIDSMMDTTNPAVLRFVGKEGSFGENMGLSNDWAYRIIKHIGNYSESFERHVGQNTPLGISRGLNALWTDGGLQYAPPIR
ncbi:MAG: amino acid ABC transporter substrate-binding protein [Hyphomicrobiales bacterium]|nr:amino acid ABC transporter substrate-binding protein [Hyphomicrobiales bacterium]MCY4049409.1 amino acid ABC transporter substrate-binding protein [Hyphomicrobiales bacterium]MCY4052816.1 amino acid ABC transporter substrate-binding protein [Hyphomicrobiales bacterium]